MYKRVRNAYLRQMKILLYTNCASVVVPQMNAQMCGIFTSSTLDSRPYGSYGLTPQSKQIVKMALNLTDNLELSNARLSRAVCNVI